MDDNIRSFIKKGLNIDDKSNYKDLIKKSKIWMWACIPTLILAFVFSFILPLRWNLGYWTMVVFPLTVIVFVELEERIRRYKVGEALEAKYLNVPFIKKQLGIDAISNYSKKIKSLQRMKTIYKFFFYIGAGYSMLYLVTYTVLVFYWDTLIIAPFLIYVLFLLRKSLNHRIVLCEIGLKLDETITE
jgi:hypothetical protein